MTNHILAITLLLFRIRDKNEPVIVNALLKFALPSIVTLTLRMNVCADTPAILTLHVILTADSARFGMPSPKFTPPSYLYS